METNTGLVGEDHSSRFQVLERPTVYPGICICCGSVNRPVVNFGVQIDYEREGYGALLLCEFCCKQAASKFPSEPVAEADTSDEVRKALEEQKVALHNGLLSYLNAFSDPGVTVPLYGDDDSVPEQTEPADVTDAQPGLSDESEANGRIAIETSSDDSKQGSTSVSSNSSDGDDDPLGFLRNV